jgi:CheY-like chemotaxis protein
MSALLVDDDPGSRAANLGRLERGGYLVTSCADVAEGLRLARNSTHDVIFLRLGKGGSGNTSFLEHLRAQDETRHVRVVILSRDRDRAMAKLGLNVIDHESW